VFDLPSHRLQAMAAELGIVAASPHRADSDVAVTRQLFAHLVERLGALTPRALWQAAVRQRVVEPAIVEAAQRAAELRCPVVVCYRPAGRAPKEFSFFVKAVRTDLDPPVVLGYLQRNRGRRELRVDRIVSIEMPSP
jgi:DNA polymerase-3 subunit epsilon